MWLVHFIPAFRTRGSVVGGRRETISVDEVLYGRPAEPWSELPLRLYLLHTMVDCFTFHRPV